MKRTTAEQEVSLCYHVICLVINYLAVKHSLKAKFVWFTFQRYGGQWKYLSHWLLYINTLYTFFAVIVDVINILKGYTCRPTGEDERPVIVRVRDEVFNSVCFPFGVGHTLVFLLTTLINTGFFVSLINRRKEDLKSYYMLHLHVFPLVFCILEAAMVYHKQKESKRQALKLPVFLSTLFLGWILWVAYFAKYWSYPFLRRANIPVKVLCLALLPPVAAGCHYLGTKTTEYFWGPLSEVAIETEDKKKKD